MLCYWRNELLHVTDTSTWQHTSRTTDRHSWSRWDSNPQSQQASGHGIYVLQFWINYHNQEGWVYNIRMDLQEVGCGYVDWIGLAQDRDRWRTLVSAVMNLRVQWNVGNFLTSCKPVICSGRTLHHGVSK